MNEIHKQFDLNLLKVMVAIAQTGSVTDAARSLNVTQSAVSHSLNRLREALDDRLFERQGKRFVPTTAARTLLPQLEKQLSDLTTLLNSAQQFNPANLQATFTLGFRDVMESITFPQLLPRFANAAPGVKLISRQVQIERLEQELNSGQLDLAVDLDYPTGANIHSQVVGHEQVVLLAASNHMLNNRITITEYATARHVMVSLRNSGPELLDQTLASLNIERDIVLKCQHFFAASQVVAATDWLVAMPAAFARQMTEILPVKMLVPPFDSPLLPVKLYWHKYQENDPGNMWLRELAIKIMAASPEFGSRKAP